MIKKIGQLMLYVEDQQKAVDFWVDKMNFTVLADDDNGFGMRWIEIAPSEEEGTSFILHDKKMVQEMSPEVTLATPSLMFFTDKIEELHSDLVEKEVVVGDLIEIPTGKIFNFADPEGNYFAVTEK